MIIVKIREIVRSVFISLKKFYLVKIFKMNIHKSALISFGAKLDLTFPKGINIASETYVASGAIIFTHDYSRLIKTNTLIGARCFIGVNSIIMPGVTIGDSVIIGSGAVVTKDVQSHCIVVGNPAKVIKSDINTIKYGKIKK